MSLLELGLVIGCLYAIAIMATWYLANNLSVEYALWIGPIIDTPTPLIGIIRIAVTILACVVIPQLFIAPVLLICIGYSIMLTLILSRFWLISWLAYVAQITACLIVVYAGVTFISVFAMSLLFILADYISNRSNYKRYDRYVLQTYRYLKRRHGAKLTKLSPEQKLMVYSIMISENMNRPIGLRLIEWAAKATYYRNQGLSTGIMQVHSRTSLSDAASVRLAARMIRFCDLLLQIKNNENSYERAQKVALHYNGSRSYVDRFFCDIYEVIAPAHSI